MGKCVSGASRFDGNSGWGDQAYGPHGKKSGFRDGCERCEGGWLCLVYSLWKYMKILKDDGGQRRWILVWWGVASKDSQISESSGQWIEDILGVLWACSFADCLSQHFREGTAKKHVSIICNICIMFQHLPSVSISVQHFPSFNIIYPVCCWHVVSMLFLYQTASFLRCLTLWEENVKVWQKVTNCDAISSVRRLEFGCGSRATSGQNSRCKGRGHQGVWRHRVQVQSALVSPCGASPNTYHVASWCVTPLVTPLISTIYCDTGRDMSSQGWSS